MDTEPAHRVYVGGEGPRVVRYQKQHTYRPFRLRATIVCSIFCHLLNPAPSLTARHSFIINRTTFMSLIIWNILLSFYGRSETNIPLKATSHSKMDPIDRQHFQKMGLSKEEIRSTEKEVKQNRKQGEYACFCCGKFEVQFGGKLKSCAKCSSVGRSVRYCSRQVPPVSFF